MGQVVPFIRENIRHELARLSEACLVFGEGYTRREHYFGIVCTKINAPHVRQVLQPRKVRGLRGKEHAMRVLLVNLLFLFHKRQI